MLAAVPVVGLFKLLLKKLLFKIDGDHEQAPRCNRCYEVDGDKLRVFSEQPIITDMLLAVIGTPDVTLLNRIWPRSFAVPRKPRHRRLSSPASGNLQDPRRGASAHYTAEQGMLHRLHRCSAFDSDADKECLRLGTLFKSPWAMLLFKRRKQRPTGR